MKSGLASWLVTQCDLFFWRATSELVVHSADVIFTHRFLSEVTCKGAHSDALAQDGTVIKHAGLAVLNAYQREEQNTSSFPSSRSESQDRCA